MYKFVNEAEVKPYRSFCSEILTKLRELLLENYEINTQFVLVGSGARNMVMRDGSSPFDLDYNLIIINMPKLYWDDLKKFKNLIISSLNKIVDNTWFSDGHDSTSVVSSYIHRKHTSRVTFKIDIAILRRNSQGNLCRLIHNKRYKTYNWCEVPSSKNIKIKADKLKKIGLWNDVRDTYKKLKNHYLRRGDSNHPSFVVYIEAVNQVYQNI